MNIVGFVKSDDGALVSGALQYAVTNGAAILVGYLGTDPCLTIPNTIEGLPVRSVGQQNPDAGEQHVEAKQPVSSSSEPL
jgi:hypothetical protein